VSDLIGMNALAKQLAISRNVLREMVVAGKIPFIWGKAGKRLFVKEVVIQAIGKEMLGEVQSGTRSLPTHNAGTDGPRPDCLEEKPGV